MVGGHIMIQYNLKVQLNRMKVTQTNKYHISGVILVQLGQEWN